MRKLLIFTSILATLSVSGCASVDKLPFVHRIDVQQGNVVKQEDLNKLEPGMSKRQVQFILGTPMIDDTFHAQRWDYLYLMEPGHGETESHRVTLLFQDDKLTEITGDKRPNPQAVAAADTTPKNTTVTVPPQKRKPRGLLSQFWQWITFSEDEEIPR